MKLAIYAAIIAFLAPFNGLAGDLTGEKIIILGDSQIEGVWSDVGPNLEEILRERGAEVIRMGIGASSSKVWYKTLQGKRHSLSKKFPWTKKWTIEHLKAQKPDQIIISLGGNTSWLGKYGKNAGIMGTYHFKHTFPLMKTLKEITPNVIWFGPSHRWDSVSKKNQKKIRHGRGQTDDFLHYYASLAGIRYVSMLKWSLEDKKLRLLTAKEKRYDGVHYRGASAACYARVMASNIQK